MLWLLLTYKNPCHCWRTRVCCYTLTNPDYLAPFRTRQCCVQKRHSWIKKDLDWAGMPLVLLKCECSQLLWIMLSNTRNPHPSPYWRPWQHQTVLAVSPAVWSESPDGRVQTSAKLVNLLVWLCTMEPSEFQPGYLQGILDNLDILERVRCNHWGQYRKIGNWKKIQFFSVENNNKSTSFSKNFVTL